MAINITARRPSFILRLCFRTFESPLRVVGRFQMRDSCSSGKFEALRYPKQEVVCYCSSMSENEAESLEHPRVRLEASAEV
jgi:hypothetical protein